MKKYWLKCPYCIIGGIFVREYEDEDCQDIFSFCPNCYVELKPDTVDKLIDNKQFIERDKVKWSEFDSDLQPMSPKIWDSGEWMFDRPKKRRAMFDRHGWKEA